MNQSFSYLNIWSIFFPGLGNKTSKINRCKRKYTRYLEEMLKMASMEINQEAPDFEIEDFKGNSFKLSNFRGKSNVLIILNRGFV